MLRALVVLAILMLTVLPAEAKRVALVIGNNTYPNLATADNPDKGQLAKAVNDAKAMRDLLENDLKFDDVLFAENAGQAKFKDLLFQFAAKLAKDDVAVFYYAGHGAALNGVNYFVPSDIPQPALQDEAGEDEILAEQARLAEFSVRESLALAQISTKKPRLSLLVIDACRDNPLRATSPDNPFRDLRSGDVLFGGGFDSRDQRKVEGMMIVYSASFGQRAMDSVKGKEADPNSPFTATLVKNLRTPGIGLKQAMEQTSDEVFEIAKAANHDQSPAVYSQLRGLKGGDLYLNGEPRKTVEVPPDSLAADFELAGRLGTKEGWEEFLARHGAKSDFRIGVANRELEKFKVAVLDVPPKVEEPTKQECATALTKVADKEVCLTPGDEFTDCDGCPEMVVVPAGSFTMGSPKEEEGHQSDEEPTRTVTIAKAFAVGKFEITRGQFAAFVESVKGSSYGVGFTCEVVDQVVKDAYYGDGWKNMASKNFTDPGFAQTDVHPAVCVSWEDAVAYAKWLSGKTGQTYRLLSEAEWEYTARGNSHASFSFGANATDLCKYGNGVDQTAEINKGITMMYVFGIAISGSGSSYDCDDKFTFTAPIGSFSKNEFGLQDMHGNVSEWVHDCIAKSYKDAPVDGRPSKDSSGCNRVIRGGSWLDEPQDLGSARRFADMPGRRRFHLGFRMARVTK